MKPPHWLIGIVVAAGLVAYVPLAYVAAVFAAVGGLVPLALLIVANGLVWAVAAVLCFAMPWAARPALMATASMLLVVPVLVGASVLAGESEWGPWSIVPVMAGLAAVALLFLALRFPWAYAGSVVAASVPVVLAGQDAGLASVPLIAALVLAGLALLLPRRLSPPADSAPHAP